jgi:2-polyprenyl-3-methyl-5-hydroxy-6-metoxy-1,4-benzoquinol methylase
MYLYVFIINIIIIKIGTHDWNKFIKPEELTRLVENSLSVRPNENIEGNVYNGIMKVKKIQGLRFNGPPRKAISWSLDDNDIDVNYILHAVLTK